MTDLRRRLQALLAEASADWRPALAAELLADAVRDADLSGRIDDDRVRDAIGRPLLLAADRLEAATARARATVAPFKPQLRYHAGTRIGDRLVAELPQPGGGRAQVEGAVVDMGPSCLALRGDDGAQMLVPRARVLRNLTARPAGGERGGAA